MATINSPRSRIVLISGARRSGAVVGTVLTPGVGSGGGCGVAHTMAAQRATASAKPSADNMYPARRKAALAGQVGMQLPPFLVESPSSAPAHIGHGGL